jgi:hypothetical protein
MKRPKWVRLGEKKEISAMETQRLNLPNFECSTHR